jgi:hypothetical protein
VFVRATANMKPSCYLVDDVTIRQEPWRSSRYAVRMRVRLASSVATALAVAVGVVSCSSYSTHEGEPTAEAGGPVDATIDAPSESGDDTLDASDAADATDAGPTNVLQNGDFELPACAQWGVQAGSAQDTNQNPHGGSLACRVCSKSTADAATVEPVLVQNTSIAPQMGERWIAEAWVRGTSDSTPPGNVYLYAKTRDAAGTAVDTASSATAPALTPTWIHLAAVLDVKTAGAAKIGVTLQAVSPGNVSQCMVVDDFSLYRTE